MNPKKVDKIDTHKKRGQKQIALLMIVRRAICVQAEPAASTGQNRYPYLQLCHCKRPRSETQRSRFVPKSKKHPVRLRGLAKGGNPCQRGVSELPLQCKIDISTKALELIELRH